MRKRIWILCLLFLLLGSSAGSPAGFAAAAADQPAAAIAAVPRTVVFEAFLHGG